jgi:pyroglutamyl-peptidase
VPLPVPAKRLAAAARAAGVPAHISRDAGSYLCNYLCWRACEAAFKPGGPRLAAFVHVPLVARSCRGRAVGAPLTLDDLLRAGEAIVMVATATARTSR